MKFNDLPAFFSKLQNLKLLNLDSTNITTLPNSMHKMTKLLKMSLEGVKLKSLLADEKSIAFYQKHFIEN